MKEMKENQLPELYYTMLEDLQAIDFVLVELTLYLDTHPLDEAAIQQYNQLAQQRMHIAHQFQVEFGPLTAFGHSYSRSPWQWTEPPWPWQV